MAKPTEQQIIDYIRKHKEEFPIKLLRDRILQQGVSEELADDAIWKALGGRVSGSSEPQEDTPEATAEILFKNLMIAVWADGTVDEREKALVKEASSLLGIDDSRIRRWVAELRSGPLRILTPRSAAVRSASLDLMIAVCKADEEIDVRELGMLKKVAEHFGLSQDELSRRLGSVTIKTVARELGKEEHAEVPAPPPFAPAPAPHSESEDESAKAVPVPEPVEDVPAPEPPPEASEDRPREFKPVPLSQNKPLIGGVALIVVAVGLGVALKMWKAGPPAAAPAAGEVPAEKMGSTEPVAEPDFDADEARTPAEEALELPEPESGEAVIDSTETAKAAGTKDPAAAPEPEPVKAEPPVPVKEEQGASPPAPEAKKPASPKAPKAVKKKPSRKRVSAKKKRRSKRRRPRTVHRSKKRLASKKAAKVLAEVRAPAWTGVPAAELTADIRIELEIVVPPTPVWDEPGLQYVLSGDLQQKGPRLYASRGKAGAVVWASVKGKKGSFPLHLPFAWMPDGTVPAIQKISDMAFFALQTGGRPDAAFTGAKPLAVFSSVMYYEDAGKENAFVLVRYGFQQKESVGGTRVYEGTRTAVWPYEKAFLAAQASRGREGTPLREAASALLSKMK